MSNNTQDSQPALHHVRHVASMLETVISHVQGDLQKIDDSKAHALFESAADVLINLKAGFDEFAGWDSQANPEAQTRPADSPAAKSKEPKSPAPKSKEPMPAKEVYAPNEKPQKPTADATHARTAAPAPELTGLDE